MSFVADVVVANDESHIVDFRSRYLRGLVDVHFIGESEVTFSGAKNRSILPKRERGHQSIFLKQKSLSFLRGFSTQRQIRLGEETSSEIFS